MPTIRVFVLVITGATAALSTMFVSSGTLTAKTYHEPYFWKPGSYQIVPVQNVTPLIATEVISTSGIPPGGFCSNNGIPTTSSNGPIQLNSAGGALGANGHGNTCSNFILQYNNDDQFGMPFAIFNNVVSGTPQVSFGVSRQIDGIRANALYIIQKDDGPPGWDFMGPSAGSGTYDPTSLFGKAMLLVTGDGTTTQAGVFFAQAQMLGVNRTLFATATDVNAPALIAGYGNATCCPTSATEVWRLEDNGHQHVGGAHASGNLSVSSCGLGSPSIAGADNAFVITLGSGTPTACTVTFHTTWQSTDLTCNFISESDAVSWKFSKVGSTNAWTGVTLTASRTLTDGSKVHGTCIGHV